MARETIAGVKRAGAAKLREQREAFEIKLEAQRRDHQSVVEQYLTQAADLTERNSRLTQRIDQLIENGNERVLEQARKTDAAYVQVTDLQNQNFAIDRELADAKFKIIDLEDALTSAAEVIARLARRPKGD
jgi:hypothetical protein